MDLDGIVVEDSSRARQFGRVEASSCCCHRDWDNAGNRRETGESREAVKLESAMPESAFDIVVEAITDDATLIEYCRLEIHRNSTSVGSGGMRLQVVGELYRPETSNE